MRVSRIAAAAAVVLVLGVVLRPPVAHATLRPDELLLVVNKNVPDGVRFAERYAKVRGVPDGRIAELALPTGDEISFDQYERDVVPAVRRYLTEHHLETKVRCLVTFYGVPLRIARRPAAGPDEQREVTELKRQIVQAGSQIESIVLDFEKLAKKLDPTFEARLIPGAGGVEGAARRADRAAEVIERRLPDVKDPAAREEARQSMLKILEQLAGPDAVTIHLAKEALAKPGVTPAEKEKWDKLLGFVVQSKARAKDLAAARYDAAARAKLRDLAREQFGLIEYAGIVQGQLAYLMPGDTAAALDNELALLWWDLYPRAAWQANPLYYGAPHAGSPPVLMVSRLDAPTMDVLNRMLADSLKAEETGLRGRVVVDTRGLPATQGGKPHPYGVFDQRLRNFADLVRGKPGVDLYLDSKPDVLPPGSTDNVALYVGWYSVGHYVPGMKFEPGAVGYHVASFELSSLHAPGGYWVPHLLTDGCAGSLGPVAEPYLLAFPSPDEFFPLLMTGKVTLAEAYWKTTPMTSWMIALVGDPLYNPFAKAPMLGVSDLPSRLQGATREAIIAPPAPAVPVQEPAGAAAATRP